ncbi:MAG: HEPN domain-containing protein, partial [Cyclobacteriaceae bacterium]|nr:HEPN domain-containing protein [Cyclobacteriaceae bacterium]
MLAVAVDSGNFKVYAPLANFYWEGEDFEIATGLHIKKLKNTPNLAGMEKWVGKDEWQSALSTDYWLIFDWATDNTPSPSEIINLVLLSLWLIKPVRCHVKLHFARGLGSASGENKRSRHLDRFMWVPGTIDPDFTQKEMRQLSRYYRKLASICTTRGRLNDALLLTITGCWSHAWQSSIICHSAAVETILTYSTARGLTFRLAKSYACLTRRSKFKRDKAFKNFRNLYSIRSDLVHGRTFNV